MAPGDADVRLIDLGTLAAGPSGDRTADPPRAPRRWSAARAPVAVAVALGCLALLALTGSVRGTSPPRLREVPLPPGARSIYFRTGDKTITLNGGLLSLWNVADNRSYAVVLEPTVREWPQPLDGLVYGIGGGVAVHVRDRCTDGDALVDIRDVRDGHLRARVKGSPVGGAHGLVAVLARQDLRCVPMPQDAGSRAAPAKQILRVYDLTSGAVLWASTALAGPVQPVVGRPRGRPVLYGLDAGGRWLVLDLATGAPVAPSGTPADLSLGARRDGTTVVRSLVPTDAAVVVTSQRVRTVSGDGFVPVDESPVTEGFDPGSLRRRWSRTVGTDPQLPAWAEPVGCGPVTCLNEPSGVVALDAAGAVRWRAPGRRVARQVGAHWALSSGVGQAQAGIEYDAYDAVLDTRTGATVMRLGPWQPAVSLVGAGPLPARLVVYRWDGGRTVVGVLDLDRGDTQPVLRGWVPGQASACGAEGRYVACRTQAGNAGLWRLSG